MFKADVMQEQEDGLEHVITTLKTFKQISIIFYFIITVIWVTPYLSNFNNLCHLTTWL